jgi:hypothetical protein
MHFSNAELGLYIRLLCVQWSTGSVPDNDLELISYGRGSVSLDRIRLKFKKCADGKLRNSRMEIERKKQIAFRKSRSENGKLGGRPRIASDNLVVNLAKAKKSSPSPSPSSVVKRESDFPETPPMSRKDFDAMVDLRGYPKECAEWFWNIHDGTNWTDAAGRPIQKVESLLKNAVVKWRSKPKINGSNNSQGERIYVPDMTYDSSKDTR